MTAAYFWLCQGLFQAGSYTWLCQRLHLAGSRAPFAGVSGHASGAHCLLLGWLNPALGGVKAYDRRCQVFGWTKAYFRLGYVLAFTIRSIPNPIEF